MAIDATPSTVATNALQAIPYGALIGAPLKAAIEAQAMAAQTSWEFIQNVGLTGPPEARQAINVSFQYQKNGQMVNLVVPLLSIVPIPYISIDTININFKANISASSSSTTETASTESFEGGTNGEIGFKVGPFSLKANFNANYSSKKDSKASQESKYSVEYTMDVQVAASQSDMPAGLAVVLDILRSAITDASPQGSISIENPKPQIAINEPITNTDAIYAGFRNSSLKDVNLVTMRKLNALNANSAEADDAVIINFAVVLKNEMGVVIEGKSVTLSVDAPTGTDLPTIKVADGQAATPEFKDSATSESDVDGKTFFQIEATPNAKTNEITSPITVIYLLKLEAEIITGSPARADTFLTVIEYPPTPADETTPQALATGKTTRPASGGGTSTNTGN